MARSNGGAVEHTVRGAAIVLSPSRASQEAMGPGTLLTCRVAACALNFQLPTSRPQERPAAPDLLISSTPVACDPDHKRSRGQEANKVADVMHGDFYAWRPALSTSKDQTTDHQKVKLLL
jgi:hypothetical protein